MKYYHMGYTFNEAEKCNYIYCSKVDMHGLDQYVVTDGKRLSPIWKTAGCFYDSRKSDTWSDYILSNLCIPIVSPKFVELTYDLLKNQVEFLDVTITDEKDGSVTYGFKVLNVLNLVDAIDLEHSDYFTIELDGETIYSVKKEAIFEEKVKDFDIFRLEKSEIAIIVSEKLKKIACKNKLTGFYFREIRVY